jgi:hypothetical protein
MALWITLQIALCGKLWRTLHLPVLLAMSAAVPTVATVAPSATAPSPAVASIAPIKVKLRHPVATAAAAAPASVKRDADAPLGEREARSGAH